MERSTQTTKVYIIRNLLSATLALALTFTLGCEDEAANKAAEAEKAAKRAAHVADSLVAIEQAEAAAAAEEAKAEAERKAEEEAKAEAERIAAAKARAEAEEKAKKAAAEYIKAQKEKALKEGRTFTDERDGKTYMWVKIGTQTWMAENLNYRTENSQCYGEDPGIITSWKDTGKNEPGSMVAINKKLSNAEIQANCQIYGRFYSYYDDGEKVCPSGWHLPSKEEWQTLVNFAGGEEIAGKKLKAKSGWIDFETTRSGNGEDTFGFSALSGGEYVSRGGSEDDYDGTGFENIGSIGSWLSSTTESGTGELGDWTQIFTLILWHDRNDGVIGNCSSGMCFIRCVKD